MRDVTDYIFGNVTARVRGADTARFLNKCAAYGVRLRRAAVEDAYTLRVKAARRGAERLPEAAAAAGCELLESRGRGLPVQMKKLRRRIALMVGCAVTLLALFWSSLYIWEIDVIGNREASTAEILTALEEAGVGIGVQWPGLNDDLIRCQVLLDVEELCWLTVNVRGSRATVVVRERVPKPDMVCEDVPGNVAAGASGVIDRLHVLRGFPLVGEGDTVMKYDVIVSGAVPSTFSPTRLERAMAKVTARTWYDITAVRELERDEKNYTGVEKNRFAVIIGDRRINFYGSSSISWACCDKIISETRLRLAGVFTLPVTLLRETYREYEPAPASQDGDGLRDELERTLMERLRDGLEADGETVTASCVTARRGGAIYVTLRAECLETVGVEVPMTQAEIEAVESENAAREAE